MGNKYILGDNISETLLIPLCSRAEITKKYPSYFNFPSSIEILNKIDLKGRNLKMSDYGDFCTGLRELQITEEAKKFLKIFPNATVVNIGCGLGDLFSSMDNGKINFYNLDLEEVINLRKDLLPLHEREYNITKSFLDFSFSDEITYEEENGIVFLMMGIVHYFEVNEIKKFIEFITKKYKNGKLIFDSCCPMGMKINSKKIKELGINGADMKFFIKNPNVFKTWSENIKNLSLNYYWASCLKEKKDMKFLYRILLRIAQIFKAMYIVKIDF